MKKQKKPIPIPSKDCRICHGTGLIRYISGETELCDCVVMQFRGAKN